MAHNLEWYMLDKLQIVKQRFDEVSDLIIQPDIISDQKRYVELNKEYKDLRVLMDKREQYITLTENLKKLRTLFLMAAIPKWWTWPKCNMRRPKKGFRNWKKK